MSPRMVSDGSVKVTNVGTPQEPNLVFSDGPAPIDWEHFFDTLQERALETQGSAKRELLFRLNARLQGIDPGQPVYWRGL